MIVVSDTSPIPNLARVRRLELLPSLYGQVLVPPAVYHELTRAKNVATGVIELALNSWLTVDTVKNQELVLQLCRNIDAGEAEAIVLALERQASLLLVDEKLGREAAKKLGLRTIPRGSYYSGRDVNQTADLPASAADRRSQEDSWPRVR